MTEKSFLLGIVTPDREFFSGNVESVVVNTPSGEMGLLAHALPRISVLKAGVLKICASGRWMEAANSDGLVYVLPDKVTILSELCEWPHEVDAAKAEREIALLRDKERKAKSAREYNMAKAQLAVQFAKLKIKNHGE